MKVIDRRILRRMGDGEEWTAWELAKAVGVSRQSASGSAIRLLNAGYLTREMDEKHGYVYTLRQAEAQT